MYKFLLVLFLLTSLNLSAQDKKIDKLEVLYDQMHYTKVVRKANALLANPEYDYSGMPSFYKSISLLRLIGVPEYYKRHKKALNQGVESYRKFLTYQNTSHYIASHYKEIADLKTYLKKVEKDFYNNAKKKEAAILKAFINIELKQIKGTFKSKPAKINNTNKENPVAQNNSSIENELVSYAKNYIGVPYVWAGSDPSGFDCSGYTSYVLKNFDVLVSRTAAGQMNDSKKIKIGNAQKGDLVFFGHGGNITHVGIVVSNKGEPLTMIHASTSKGIMITNIEKSTYWKPKLKGVGRVLE